MKGYMVFLILVSFVCYGDAYDIKAAKQFAYSLGHEVENSQFTGFCYDTERPYGAYIEQELDNEIKRIYAPKGKPSIVRNYWFYSESFKNKFKLKEGFVFDGLEGVGAIAVRFEERKFRCNGCKDTPRIHWDFYISDEYDLGWNTDERANFGVRSTSLFDFKRLAGIEFDVQERLVSALNTKLIIRHDKYKVSRGTSIYAFHRDFLKGYNLITFGMYPGGLEGTMEVHFYKTEGEPNNETDTLTHKITIPKEIVNILQEEKLHYTMLFKNKVSQRKTDCAIN